MKKKVISLLCVALCTWGLKAQETSFEWISKTGGTDREISRAITADDEGNVYVAGTFDGTTDFDPGDGVMELTSTEEADIFIQKLNADGELIWVKHISGELGKTVNQLKVTPSGNILLVGIFNGNLDVDPGAGEYILTSITDGVSDSFLLEIDPAGEFNWAQRLLGLTDMEETESHLSTHIRSVEYNEDGDLFIGGDIFGTLNVGSDEDIYEVSSNGTSDFFVEKRNADGTLVWHKQVGSIWYDFGVFDLTDSGEVIASGFFKYTVDFDPGPGEYEITSDAAEAGGNPDGFLLKLADNGDFIWAKSFGGPSHELVSNIVVMPSGDFCISGYFSGEGEFNPGEETAGQTSNGATDIFISKFNGSGELLWNYSIGSTHLDIPDQIKTDPFNQIYLTGTFDQTIDLDPGPEEENYTSIGNNDYFIIKLDEEGNLLWSGQLAGEAWGKLLSIEVDEDENIYGTASYEDSIRVDLTAETSIMLSEGSSDFFTFKLNTSETVSINDFKEPTEILVYPNPTSGYLNIELRNDKNAGSLSLMNALGQVVYSVQINSGDYYKDEINMENLDSGIYILNFNDGHSEIRKKVIKQ